MHRDRPQILRPVDTCKERAHSSHTASSGKPAARPPGAPEEASSRVLQPPPLSGLQPRTLPKDVQAHPGLVCVLEVDSTETSSSHHSAS